MLYFFPTTGKPSHLFPEMKLDVVLFTSLVRWSLQEGISYREIEKGYLPNSLLSKVARKAGQARVGGEELEGFPFPEWSQKEYHSGFCKKGSIGFGAEQTSLVWIYPYCRTVSIPEAWSLECPNVSICHREQRNPQVETITNQPLCFTVKRCLQRLRDFPTVTPVLVTELGLDASPMIPVCFIPQPWVRPK